MKGAQSGHWFFSLIRADCQSIGHPFARMKGLFQGLVQHVFCVPSLVRSRSGRALSSLKKIAYQVRYLIRGGVHGEVTSVQDTDPRLWNIAAIGFGFR
jgi:hypothetical protein